MFRFTIRDVLWLTVVAALIVALWMEDRRTAVVRADLLAAQEKLRVALEELRVFHAQKAIADLRAKELRGGVILTPSPAPGFKAPERREEAPQPKDR